MKKTLSHLPKEIADTITEVAEIIRTVADPEMIILFGSYARGDYVVRDTYTDPEDHRTYEYRSDFDFLVITSREDRAKANWLWQKCEKQIREAGITTPVSIIAHQIQFVNRALRRGDYFFADIDREGVLLFDSGNFELDERRDMSQEQRLKMACDDYEQWFGSGCKFLANARTNTELGWHEHAAFFFHQAAEAFYAAILLVFTQYKPKSHYLPDLQKMTARFDPRLIAIFPQETEEEKYRFDLLVRAYVDARYKKNYSICKEELEYLGERVGRLRDLTEEICRERIGKAGD